MPVFVALPEDIIIEICYYLATPKDFFRLSLTSRRIHAICFSRAGGLVSILQHLCLKELRHYSFSSSSKQRLKHAIILNRNTAFATAGLGALWSSRSRGQSAFCAKIQAVILGISYERRGCVYKALKILEELWQERTNNDSVPLEMVEPGIRLATLYETGGRVDLAIEILEKIWTVRTQYSKGIANVTTKPAMHLARLYKETGRVTDSNHIREIIRSEQRNP